MAGPGRNGGPRRDTGAPQLKGSGAQGRSVILLGEEGRTQRIRGRAPGCREHSPGSKPSRRVRREEVVFRLSMLGDSRGACSQERNPGGGRRCRFLPAPGRRAPLTAGLGRDQGTPAIPQVPSSPPHTCTQAHPASATLNLLLPLPKPPGPLPASLLTHLPVSAQVPPPPGSLPGAPYVPCLL